MTSRQPGKTRPIIRSVDKLIERFLYIETSVEEAHGLLDVIGQSKRNGMKGIERVNRSDRANIVAFLCVIGSEIDIHPCVADHKDLRSRARVVLARNAIPDLRFYDFNDVEDATRAIRATSDKICRFFADERLEHCSVRHNEQDLDKLRNFFGPHSTSFDPTNDSYDFYLALANLGLTDILVARRDIGAIPVLAEWLSTFECAAPVSAEFPILHDVDKIKLLLTEDWVDRAAFNQAYHDKLTKRPHQTLTYLLDAIHGFSAFAGFVLAQAHQAKDKRAQDEHVEVARSLAALCAMAENLLQAVLCISY